MKLRIALLCLLAGLILCPLQAQNSSATERLYSYLENDNIEYGEAADLLKSFRAFIREFTDEEVSTCNKKECLILDILHLWMGYVYDFEKEQSELLRDDLEYFLNKGIDLNTRYSGYSEYMFSELFFTGLSALDELNEEMFVDTHYETLVSAFLAIGIDFTVPMSKGKRWMSISQFLVSVEGDPGYPGWDSALKVLIDKKVSMTIRQKKLWSPFMTSILTPTSKAFDMILESGLDVNRVEGNWTAFDLIIYGTDSTDFHKVVRLIDAGYDLKSVSKSLDGMTPLMTLAYSYYSDKKELKRVIEKMKEQQIDFNAVDENGNTAIHHAVLAFDTWYCFYLDGLVDWEIKNKKGQTALDLTRELRKKKKYAKSKALLWLESHLGGGNM